MNTSTIVGSSPHPETTSVIRSRRLQTGILCVLIASIVAPSIAIDLETLSSIPGPLGPALATLSTLTPGLKAIVAFITFCVAFIALAGLRSFAPVLFFIGVMVFGAVGLVIGGAILGAVI